MGSEEELFLQIETGLGGRTLIEKQKERECLHAKRGINAGRHATSHADDSMP
jgi:hypothetical protein